MQVLTGKYYSESSFPLDPSEMLSTIVFYVHSVGPAYYYKTRPIR